MGDTREREGLGVSKHQKARQVSMTARGSGSTSLESATRPADAPCFKSLLARSGYTDTQIV